MGSKNEHKPIMYYNGKPVGYIEEIPQVELDDCVADEEAKEAQEELTGFFRKLELWNAETEGYMKCYLQYQPQRILVSGGATIVFWADGEKTVVKRNAEDEYSLYNAFCIALAKRLFKSNSALKKLIERKTEYRYKKCREKKVREDTIEEAQAKMDIMFNYIDSVSKV